MGSVRVGIDIGQNRSPTGLCVAHAERRWFHERPRRPWYENHFHVHHLERMPAGTSYPEIAARLAEVIPGIGRRTGGCRPEVFVNVTGLGSPILDLLRAKASRVVGVYFNHGDRRIVVGQDEEIRIGMGWVVTRLQSLFQLGTLHLINTPETQILTRELPQFNVAVTEDANDRYGAFRVGTQDDLVIALGLAVQEDPPVPHTPWRRYAVA